MGLNGVAEFLDKFPCCFSLLAQVIVRLHHNKEQSMDIFIVLAGRIAIDDHSIFRVDSTKLRLCDISSNSEKYDMGDGVYSHQRR